jgi:hypothetical protein
LHAGARQLTNVLGGMTAWYAAGLPTEQINAPSPEQGPLARTAAKAVR